MKRVFIDGSAGTTGLRIRERLANRKEIELVILPEALRKDPSARRDALNGADIAFLCLPDAAAIEAVALVENPDTAIIDTSTAHRTAEGWVYGFAELPGQRARIAASKRIANPGCHASGFIALAAPLVREGLLAPDAALSCFSVTGYSGGGKKMIAEYEGEGRDPASITEQDISDRLYSAGVPDPDLIIRPSGEIRTSNFLLWQSAYSEYYFTDVLWPDFSKEELHKAIASYQKRSRRFGGV